MKLCPFCARPVDDHELAGAALWGDFPIYTCESAPEGFIGTPVEVDE
jgi:hypothetical protein